MIPDGKLIKFLLGVNPHKLPLYHKSFVKNLDCCIKQNRLCVETSLLS
jgi:hypothetical protein